MNWISDLLLGLAAPAAGVLGAWFGGNAVVKSTKASAELDRQADAARHRRERRDALEGEMRQRAEALVSAVVAVRQRPVGAGLNAHRDLWDDSPPTEFEQLKAVVDAELAKITVRFPALVPQTYALTQRADPGNPGPVEFLTDVHELSKKINSEVELLGTNEPEPGKPTGTREP